jgi:hypothetical protein
MNCFKESIGQTEQYQLYGQKNRTQKDTTSIFLRSIFLPKQVFSSCIDVIGFHPARIQACSRGLSECDTSGCGAQEVLHPDRDASYVHVSAILSGWKER